MKKLTLSLALFFVAATLKAQPVAILISPPGEGSKIMMDLQDTAGIIAIQAASAPVNQTAVITTSSLGTSLPVILPVISLQPGKVK